MLTLDYRGHTLIAVPAVHYRAVFAEMVNRICADEETRPAAVAVELEPGAAAAVAAWLRELGVAPGGKPLPYVLGLLARNRLIHPRFRAAALRLQETTGYQLQELSPRLLARELGYVPTELLPLTPTDSITEAIRCALELDLALFGIDLAHAPGGREPMSWHVRDPLTARGDLAGYVRRVDRLAEQANCGRDAYSDPRRETVMAARLKALLDRYDRVLWSGGIAHWANVCRLLADPRVLPAAVLPQGDCSGYRRVLVHPLEAAQYTDIFPRIAAAYEAARQPVGRWGVARLDLDFQAEFRSCLDSWLTGVSGRYARGGASDPAVAYHGLMSFGRYLLHVCLLTEQPVPDVATVLSVARAMLPDTFVQSLAETFLDLDWASPARFPDLPILAPDRTGRRGARQGGQRIVLRTPRTTNGDAGPAYVDSAPFAISPPEGWRGQGMADCGWRWQQEPAPASRYPWVYHHHFVWPPCDNLFYATIYEAVHLADTGALEQRAEPCTNSLHDGIDLKASLRSSLRGKPQLFVKRPLKGRMRPVAGAPVPLSYTPHLELQPVVFLFSNDAPLADLSWGCLAAGTDGLYEDLSEQGKRLFRSLPTPAPHLFLESISAGEAVPVPAQMQPWVTELHLLYGAVRFGNPCINWYQGAAWLEKGRFRAAPILQGSWSIEGVTAMYLEEHGMAIDRKDWRNALILFALPYARTTRRVVLVAPKGFRVGEQVRREAKHRGLELFTLPLSHFPAARIDQIRRQYAVVAGPGGKEFPPELEGIFGHKEWAYADLLPPEIRRQAKPRPSLRYGAEASVEVSDATVHHRGG